MLVLAKVKVPCPRCDGKGVIPQYFYNRKGICFLCWGSGYIYVNIPEGQTEEQYLANLKEKERQHLEKNPPKVEMPDASKHRNKAYFKDTKTKLKPTPDKPKTPDLTKLREVVRNTYKDFSVDELKVMLKKMEELLKKDPNEVNKATAEVILQLLDEKTASLDTTDTEGRIGRVDKSKGGDITVVATAGRYNIGTYTNAKTGKTEYTVYPEDKLDKEAWDKYKQDMKQFGGYYSRFKGKYVMEENPTDAVKKWVAGGGGITGSTDTGTNNGTNKGTDNSTGTDTGNMTERDIKRANQKKADEIIQGMTVHDYSVDGLKKIKAKLEALGDYRRKAEDMKWVDDAIKHAEEEVVNSKIREGVKAILDKYPSMYTASSDELQAMLDELKKLPSNDIVDTTISRVESSLASKKRDEERNKGRVEAEKIAKQLEADLQQKKKERLKALDYDTATKIKDTDLGKAVKELIAKGVNGEADVRAVGKLLADEYEKQIASSGEELAKAEKEHRLAKDMHSSFYDGVYTKAVRDNVGAEEMSKVQKEMDRIWEELKTASNKVEEAKQSMKDARPKAYLKTMEMVRELGFDKGEKLNTGGESNVKTKAKIVEKHMGYYPKEWVKASNIVPIEVQFTTADPYKRQNSAHYSNSYDGQVNPTLDLKNGNVAYKQVVTYAHLRFNKSSSDNTFTHEIAHRMEAINPKLIKLQAEFFESRVDLNKDRGLREATGLNYKESERYKPLKSYWNGGGDWVNPYMGKPYQTQQKFIDAEKNNPARYRYLNQEGAKAGDYEAFEILSMGMEQVVHGARGEKQSIVEADKEMMHFIFGLLATV